MENQSQPSADAAVAASSLPAAIFVSDVHLQPATPLTAQAFFKFLSGHAIDARRLYLLGDLFEYWAGDDDIDEPFHQQVVSAIRAVSDAGVEINWIAGNRDFLIGHAFADAAGMVIRQDPYVITLANTKLVLAHGDAQCTDDSGYMKFRAEVRTSEWQQNFLALPLTQRKQIIANMRDGSREAQRTKSSEIMDVNAAAIDALFKSSGAKLMIHGHTHRPARHEYGGEDGLHIRYVLPDWDCDSAVSRGGWIAMEEDGVIRRFDAGGVELR